MYTKMKFINKIVKQAYTELRDEHNKVISVKRNIWTDLRNMLNSSMITEMTDSNIRKSNWR